METVNYKGVEATIYQDDLDGRFYFEKDGDLYESIEECKKDALSVCKSKYDGTYYQESYGEYSERTTFRAMQS